MALTDDILELKAKYGNACRVIENQGDFRYIITVTFSQRKAVKLQMAIDVNYPDTAPQIIVKPASTPDTDPNSLPEECRTDLQFDMTNLADETSGAPKMVNEIFECAAVWLEAFADQEKVGKKTQAESKQIDLKPVSDVLSEITEKKKLENNKLSSDSDRSVSQPNQSAEKLPALRTSEDVISRFLWDKRVKRSLVTVGYLDRFSGVMEDKFNAFCWDQPLSAVDNDTLAIPRHRIQYFKYNGIKVWDKNERLDNVFGSTGSDVDFYDFIKQQHGEKAEGDETLEEGDLGETDDLEEGDNLDMDDLEDALGPTKKFQNPNRPNFFIAIKIDNPAIVAKAEEISSHMLTQEPMFKTCFIPPRCLHVTLSTVRLNNTNEITRAITTLKNLKSKLQSEFPEPIMLAIDKLDAFYQNVLYGNVKENPQLIQLADTVRSGLQANGVKIVETHIFSPHMTIMKINRPTQRLYGVPRIINPNLYHSFKDDKFGVQRVATIFLCPVGMDRREDGFYQSVLEMDI